MTETYILNSEWLSKYVYLIRKICSNVTFLSKSPSLRWVSFSGQFGTGINKITVGDVLFSQTMLSKGLTDWAVSCPVAERYQASKWCNFKRPLSHTGETCYSHWQHFIKNYSDLKYSRNCQNVKGSQRVSF